MRDFGGNKLTKVNLAGVEKFQFATAPYNYSICTIAAGRSLELSELGSATVYFYSASGDAKCRLSNNSAAFQIGDTIQIEGEAAHLNVDTGTVTVLIAGTRECKGKPGIKITRAGDLKRVIKPWGHELWINGEHPGYALKQIFIRAPHKTSLQYHNFKIETNVLVSGTARLHYKNWQGIPNNEVTQLDISTEELSSVSVIEVVPSVLHRLEAVTDILLYEVSTPHLDDVVRVHDDSKRPDGRIESEHRCHN